MQKTLPGNVLQKGLIICLLLITTAAVAGDWASWRGKHQNGVSDEKNLVSEWSQDGNNLIWTGDFTGRSTPIILNGRVYVIGRVGEGVSMQERVACFSAESGELLWDYRYNVRNTYVPFNRIGWASMVGDPESGNVYAMGGGGVLHCFDKNGKILWYRSLVEEFGIRTGYGGRTTNPVIDENRVIVGFVSAGWGDQKPMKHRHFAFEKNTGELIWTATPGGAFKAPNIYSNPVITVIDGKRLFIAGNADGVVYALQSRTGEKVWEFHLSQRGLNASVVVDGNRIYAAHGEENLDSPKMGRIVCFDGSGTGDITATNEIWRFEAEIGYTSPLLVNGRIYYIDNAANMYALNATTGEKFWEYSLGTVGKASPVWADGKIYVPETNGRFHILEDAGSECKSLNLVEIAMPGGKRMAEIYGSPAIAYGRVYLATETGLFCIGNPDAAFSVTPPEGLVVDEPAGNANGKAALLQIFPAELLARSGNQVQLKAKLYDENGRYLRDADAQWQVSGPIGTVDKNGEFTPTGATNAAGMITATLDELKGVSRVRVFTDLPWEQNFETYQPGENPPYWIGASSAKSPGGKYIVADIDGNKVLEKPPAGKGIQRHFIFWGPSDMKEYILQADVMTSQDKRRRGDMGLVSNGYVLDLMGKIGRIEIRAWTSENRIRVQTPFAVEANTWYTMKMTIDYTDDKAIVKGKVWQSDTPEPQNWSIVAEDPYPSPEGSPGIYGVSNATVYYDNVKVMQK